MATSQRHGLDPSSFMHFSLRRWLVGILFFSKHWCGIMKKGFEGMDVYMRLLLPDLVAARVQDIDLQALSELGVRGLLIDLDNTLVAWDRQRIAEPVVAWLQRVQSVGFKICFVSNGMPDRVKKFSHDMGIPGVGRAIKPRRTPFRRALAILDLSPTECAVIGDQLFTDVLGGNRMGMFTILINPLSDKELRSTRLVRRVERKVLRRMARQGSISPAT